MTSSEAAVPGLHITGISGYSAHGPIHHGEWNGRAVSIRHVRKRDIPLAMHRRRLERLSGIDHPRLAGVVHVEEQAERFTILSHHVPGPTLSTLRVGGAGLPLRQAWRVLADVCEGLTLLHEHGIIHGDVSPANIIISTEGARRGRGVLIDVGGEEDWELGTVGFRAPELTDGFPASAGSDVWSAARVALWSVADEHRLYFGELLREILDADPAERPSAEWVARIAAEDAADRIEIPDDARLASAHLRARASTQPTARAGRRRKSAPTKRDYRRVRQALGALGVAAVVGGLYLAGASWIAGERNPRPPDSAEATEPHTSSDPGQALITLTKERDLALAERDVQALSAVSLPGSPAAEADLRLLESFGESRPEGLTTDVVIRDVAEHPSDTVVTAQLTQEAFTWHGGVRNGVNVAPLPARCAKVHLARLSGEWRVAQVRACGAGSQSE